MRFFAAFNLESTSYDGLKSYDVSRSLRFGTQLSGGFAAASCLIPFPRRESTLFASRMLGMEVTIYDNQGRVVYNGRVSGTDNTGDGIKMKFSGFYEEGKKITVPTALWLDPATESGDILRDCIDLVPSWIGGVDIHRSNIPVGPQDYDDEVKVSDMIDSMLKLGYDSYTSAPAYLAIYEDHIPSYLKESRDQYPDFYVSGEGRGGRVGSALSLDKVHNKIYVLYDDPEDDSVGPTMYPTPAQDLGSQFKYGIREGVMNVGEYGLSLGLQLRDVAIQKYGYPTEQRSLEVKGFVRNNGGSYVPSYNIRAGDFISIDNVDENAVLHALEINRIDGFVMSTNYDASNASMKITLASGDNRLDYLLARLGLSGGLS